MESNTSVKRASLRSLDKQTYIGLSVLAVALGLCMIIWTEQSTRIICYVIGAGMLLYGLVDCLRYFLGNDEGAAFRSGLVDGALAIGVGLFCVLRPAAVMNTFDVIIGIVALVDGLIKLQFGINLARAGYPLGRAVLLAAAAAILIGILMIVIDSMSVLVLGLLFLFNGLTDIFTVVALQRYERSRISMRPKPETENVKKAAE